MQALVTCLGLKSLRSMSSIFLLALTSTIPSITFVMVEDS